MCLLDAVLEWSDTLIVCRAVSHADPANPLRAENRLGAAAGIEYAAQAMAVHGALIAGDDAPPRQGYLTSVRSVALAQSWIFESIPSNVPALVARSGTSW